MRKAEEFMTRPVLAVKNGDVWLMSTPNGKRGFFYEKWAYGGARWARVAVRATDCPRITAEFLEEERVELVWHCSATILERIPAESD